MNKFISDRPWIWIVVSFMTMTSAMIATVFIAVRFAPQEVPLDKPEPVVLMQK